MLNLRFCGILVLSYLCIGLLFTLQDIRAFNAKRKDKYINDAIDLSSRLPFIKYCQDFFVTAYFIILRLRAIFTGCLIAQFFKNQHCNW